MYKGKFHIFTCDVCGQDEITPSFPKDFIYLPKNTIRKEMSHKHTKCATPEEISEYQKSKERHQKMGAVFY